MHRRYNIVPILKSEVKKVIQGAEVGEYLLRTNIQEKIKASESLQQMRKRKKIPPTEPHQKFLQTIQKKTCDIFSDSEFKKAFQPFHQPNPPNQ